MGLSFAQTKSALIACVRAKITAMLVGPPGCGKTALIRAVAREVTLPCHELLASNCDATDIAGLAYVANGDLRRALLPQIKACVDAPGLLFLDEISQVTPSVHGPLMRLLLEGYAGGQPLHSGSAILAAANRPEECPGGIELTAATVNRVIKITDFFPTLSEIRAFFEGLGTEGSRLREDARDFAATLAVQPDLLDMAPPRPAIDAGAQFASPRGWERALRAFAEYGSKEDDVGCALLAGGVGEAKSAMFLGIRKLRQHLPSVDEILKDPVNARVPAERDRQIAAIGLLSRVADRDMWAAWIYVTRLQPEISGASSHMLMDRCERGGAITASRWFELGKAAQRTALAKIRRAIA
jgi:hypothetical protein